MNLNDASAKQPVICILDGSVGVTGAFIAARRQAELLKGMASVVLVLPQEADLDSVDVSSFLAIERIQVARLRKSPVSLFMYLPRLIVGTVQLRRVARKHMSTRLQVNDFYLAQGHLIRLLAYRGQIATWLRINPRNFGIAGKLWLWLSKMASNNLVAVSEFVARQAPSWKRPTIIYDAAPKMPTARSTTGGHFAFLGNYVPGKGQDVAIAAFADLLKTHPQAQLRFYGSVMGLLKNEIYRINVHRDAFDLKIYNNVRVEPTTEPSEAFKGAVAALNFSRSESFSLVCQEASASGLPVIATKSGGPEEIIEDGSTGFLVEVDDVPAMAERMRYILDHPEEAAAMGDAGRVLVKERFGSQSAIDKLRNVLSL